MYMVLESWFSSKQHFCSLQRTWVGFRASMWWLTRTIIPVPWDLAPSSGFYRHQACLECTFTQASKISQRHVFEKRETQLSSGMRAWHTQTSGSAPPPHQGRKMWMRQEPCQGCSPNKREWPKQSKYLMGSGSLIFFLDAV